MKPELGKYYRTRGGHKGRVICVDALVDSFPVVALVNFNGREDIYLLTNEGLKHLDKSESHADLISEWVDKPEWDWSKAADWHVAIAMDENKDWFAYAQIPQQFTTSWGGDYCQAIPPEHAPKWTGDWRKSLIVRPGFEKEESK